MPDFIETSAPDVETAVQQALSQLALTLDQVKIEILEEPQRRLLGLGTKLARVRVTPIATPPSASPAPMSAKRVEVPAPPKHAATVINPPPEPDPFQLDEDLAAQMDAIAPTRQPVQVTVTKPPAPVTRRPKPEDHEGDEAYGDSDSAPMSAEELGREAQVGIELLQGLLTHMGLTAEVTARRAVTDGREAPHWLLEVKGEELGDLIGVKGETLGSLQAVLRLMVSQKITRRANLVIDVEGYKSKREEQLRRLARKMAAQAVERGRTVSLEPMPPHERRIIHLTLKDDPKVKTESIGDGERRKITIIPKRSGGNFRS
jgi:spoIIIJ-associated protein